MAVIAGDFDGTVAREQELVSGMTFEMYHRNHPNPPREWLEREFVMPEIVENTRS